MGSITPMAISANSSSNNCLVERKRRRFSVVQTNGRGSAARRTAYYPRSSYLPSNLHLWPISCPTSSECEMRLICKSMGRESTTSPAPPGATATPKLRLRDLRAFGKMGTGTSKTRSQSPFFRTPLVTNTPGKQDGCVPSPGRVGIIRGEASSPHLPSGTRERIPRIDRFYGKRPVQPV